MNSEMDGAKNEIDLDWLTCVTCNGYTVVKRNRRGDCKVEVSVDQ